MELLTTKMSNLHLSIKLDRVNPIKLFKMNLYEKRFYSSKYYGCFRGVYQSFEEARKSIPKTLTSSFDQSEFADQYWDRLQHIFTYDYPMLFWLNDILKINSIVFDLGGNIGIHYHSYAKYIKYHQTLTWRVCDVSKVIEFGEKYSKSRGSKNLYFTNNIAELEGADILFSAGTIQYIETPTLAESIALIKNKPKHILINKIPLYDGEPFVTVQNAEAAFVPQYVFNRENFINSFKSLGYNLVDYWSEPSRSCIIPFYPEKSIKTFSGLYLKLRDISN